MDKIKIVIVDDSTFAMTILKDMLLEKGFDVVGEAGSLEDTIDTVSRLKPDVVTMDMVMPGTDGLECTRAIHKINPNIKVIIVSSMMDEEIIRKAKNSNVSGFIQKPVDSEELSILIQRIMADEELFNELKNLYYKDFINSFIDSFKKLTKTSLNFNLETALNEEISSRGISVLVGIVGKYSGRMILDISKETAHNIAAAVLKRDKVSDNEVLAAMGEIGNIAAGNACSLINRKNKLFGLRVSPPTVLYGQSLTIVNTPHEITASGTAANSLGDINLNIGFKRGDDGWMLNT
jgi:DNA-binding NarL/FixJ family response regulator